MVVVNMVELVDLVLLAAGPFVVDMVDIGMSLCSFLCLHNSSHLYILRPLILLPLHSPLIPGLADIGVWWRGNVALAHLIAVGAGHDSNPGGSIPMTSKRF
jgi:hypothetical protein